MGEEEGSDCHPPSQMTTDGTKGRKFLGDVNCQISQVGTGQAVLQVNEGVYMCAFVGVIVEK